MDCSCRLIGMSLLMPNLLAPFLLEEPFLTTALVLYSLWLFSVSFSCLLEKTPCCESTSTLSLISFRAAPIRFLQALGETSSKMAYSK